MHVSVILFFNVHKNVSKFDRVGMYQSYNKKGQSEKKNHLEFRLKYL